MTIGVVSCACCVLKHLANHRTSQHSLAAVNFFLGMVGVVQVSRILMYQQAQKALKEKEEAEASAAVKEVVKA